MTGIEKLRKILCTAADVKKDLMELRFGTEVMTKYEKEKIIGIKESENIFTSFIDSRGNVNYRVSERQDIKEIGNPIQERHLLMYFNQSREFSCSIEFGEISLRKHKIEKDRIIPSFDIEATIDIKIDNSIDFQEQEGVIDEIVSFIELHK